MTTEEDNSPEKRESARSRWTRGLAIIGGNVCGWMFDWEALYPALTHHPYHYGQHNALATTGMFLGGFVLPVVVTILAPRKSFLWAALTLGITLLWSLMDRVVALNGPGLVHDLEGNATGHLLTLLILCGPISLTRFLIRQGKEKEAKRLAEQQIWTNMAGQEGVWPPPPNRSL